MLARYSVSVIGFLYFIAALSISPQLVAKPAELQPLTSRALTLDITQTPSGNLIAVGERGHVLVKSANESNWQQKQVPINSLLTSVFALNDKQIWAVGHDASILHSLDGGQSWQLQYQNKALQAPLLDVLFFDQNQGIAIGAYGLFLVTQDGGVSWQKQLNASLLLADDIDYLAEIRAESEEEYQIELAASMPHLNQIAYQAGQTWLVGEMGLIAKSLNRGERWQRLEDIYNGSFWDINLQPEQITVAGLRGNVFISTDQGQNWQAKPLPEPNSINKVLFEPNSNSFLFLANTNKIWCLASINQPFQLLKKLDSKVQTSGVILSKPGSKQVPVALNLWSVGDTGIEQTQFASGCNGGKL